MILSPLDALKTTMQTEGDKAIPLLRARIRNHGIGTLVSNLLAGEVNDTHRFELIVGWSICDGCCQLCWLVSLVRDVQLSLGSAPSFA